MSFWAFAYVMRSLCRMIESAYREAESEHSKAWWVWYESAYWEAESEHSKAWWVWYENANREAENEHSKAWWVRYDNSSPSGRAEEADKQLLVLHIISNSSCDTMLPMIPYHIVVVGKQ